LKYAMYLESIADNAGAIKAYEKIIEKFPDTALAASVHGDIERLSQTDTAASVAPGPPIPGL